MKIVVELNFVTNHVVVDFQALVSLQLETDCCVHMVESDQDAAKFVFNFVKSVAEAPFK